MKKCYVIDWITGFERCKKIFELYPIVDQTDKDLFLIFGYKNLTPGDKETYYLMKNLAQLNENKYNNYMCKVSMEHLGEVLSTTRQCQSIRITNLINAKIVTKVKGGGKGEASVYIPLVRVLPDSTLITTLIRLIRKKKLFTAIYNYEKEVAQYQEPKTLIEIKKIIKKVPDFKKYLSLELKKIVK